MADDAHPPPSDAKLRFEMRRKKLMEQSDRRMRLICGIKDDVDNEPRVDAQPASQPIATAADCDRLHTTTTTTSPRIEPQSSAPAEGRREQAHGTQQTAAATETGTSILFTVLTIVVAAFCSICHVNCVIPMLLSVSFPYVLNAISTTQTRHISLYNIISDAAVFLFVFVIIQALVK